MRLESITLRELRMPLVHPFETSFGRTTDRRIILVQIAAEGCSGWGEVTAGEAPFYNEESTDIAWSVLRSFVIPEVLQRPLSSLQEFPDRFEHIRGHRMALAGVETALWDCEARRTGRSISAMIGGTLREIPCGVSIGIQASIHDLLEKIRTEVEAGYQRVKIKIKPGWDIAVLDQVRLQFPRLRLMADANSAYTLADLPHLKLMDRFYLMMIEQPLAHDDLIDHARLQQSLQTPICLDESIRTLRHAEQAIEIGACQIINIKLGRVGGFTRAWEIHDCCQAAAVPVWCGGMLESGVGRAHNIALSSLPNFVLPGDVSASKRYWKHDLVVPEIQVSPQGTIHVPEGIGTGFEADLERIEQLTVRRESFS